MVLLLWMALCSFWAKKCSPTLYLCNDRSKGPQRLTILLEVMKLGSEPDFLISSLLSFPQRQTVFLRFLFWKNKLWRERIKQSERNLWKPFYFWWSVLLFSLQNGALAPCSSTNVDWSDLPVFTDLWSVGVWGTFEIVQSRSFWMIQSCTILSSNEPFHRNSVQEATVPSEASLTAAGVGGGSWDLSQSLHHPSPPGTLAPMSEHWALWWADSKMKGLVLALIFSLKKLRPYLYSLNYILKYLLKKRCSEGKNSIPCKSEKVFILLSHLIKDM